MRAIDGRLRRLEGRAVVVAWCRCPFDHGAFKREVLPLMGTAGAETPAHCARCGGARPVLRFVAMESAMWHHEAVS